MSVCPVKTQISLGIRPVWSESSLCAQWVAKDLRFLHADSEDWSDWADAQADLSLRWAHSRIVDFVIVTAQFFLNDYKWLIMAVPVFGSVRSFRFQLHTLVFVFFCIFSSLKLLTKDFLIHVHVSHACVVCANKLSRDMAKPTKWVCAQRRLRSAWASAQSDQSLRFRMKKAWVLSYPLSAQWRLWSDWADAGYKLILLRRLYCLFSCYLSGIVQVSVLWNVIGSFASIIIQK